jgi:hypothetical protein
LEPSVPYDSLVQVMDTVRLYQLPVAPFSKAELFPDISLGDAPSLGDAATPADAPKPGNAPT